MKFSAQEFLKRNTVAQQVKKFVDLLKKRNSPNLLSDLNAVLENKITADMPVEIRMLSQLMHNTDKFIGDDCNVLLKATIITDIQTALINVITELENLNKLVSCMQKG